MGRQARLRAQRRAEHERVHPPLDTAASTPPPAGAATATLRDILLDIRANTLLAPLRCWELMVEMLAHHSGWQTDTNEDADIWELIPFPEQRFKRYAQEWNQEVSAARSLGRTFSEPLGDLLHESGGPRMMPMNEVHAKNRRLLAEARVNQNTDPDETFDGVCVPGCGTGRFVLDTLVFDDRIQVFAAELDTWLYRAMLVNIRYLLQYSSRFYQDEPGTELRRGGEYAESMIANFERAGIPISLDRSDGLKIIGGRVWVINADPTIIDLNYTLNWQLGIQPWTLNPPWEINLMIDPRKFDGFRGTWAEYCQDQGLENAVRRLGPHQRNTVRYDFAMRDPG